MHDLKKMINEIRTENHFSPMSAILAERLLLYVAYGNYICVSYINKAFATRDSKGRILREDEAFKLEDQEQGILIAQQLNPHLWAQSEENLLSYAKEMENY